jgi:hypothetical protein
VIVDGHGQHLLRRILANHILIESRLDLLRLEHSLRRYAGFLFAVLFGDDVVA